MEHDGVFVNEWKGESYTYRLFLISRLEIDINNDAEDVYRLVGIDSGGVRRVDILFDIAYDRAIYGDRQRLVEALSSASKNVKKVLERFLDEKWV